MIMFIVHIVLIVLCFINIHTSPSVFGFLLAVNGFVLGVKASLGYVRYVLEQEIKKDKK